MLVTLRGERKILSENNCCCEVTGHAAGTHGMGGFEYSRLYDLLFTSDVYNNHVECNYCYLGDTYLHDLYVECHYCLTKR